MAAYSKILVPVDLAHLESLGKALDTAADLARHYDIPVCYVSVGREKATPVKSETFQEALDSFALDQAERFGFEATARAYTADSADAMRDTLRRAIEENEADLVVMASHIPDPDDSVFASNAAAVAARAAVSVMIVR